MRRSSIFSRIGFILGLLTAEVPAAEAATDALIDALDLNRPELAKVKTAADRDDMPAARMAFAAYLRTRTNVRWHFDPADPPKEIDTAELKLADDALVRRFSPMGVPYQFDGPINWRFNATTQRDSKVPVTHEWTWVLNRNQYWPAMAKVYLSTGKIAYAQEASRQIADWCAQNPAPEKLGSRYFSPWRQIEAGIRMGSSWPDTFFLLLRSPEAFPDDVLLAMVDTMRGHAEYLDKFPTHGNHLTMEMNGLYHVGALFPEFKAAAKWRADAIDRQRAELEVQVYPDGAQIELTSSYHCLALQMFLNTYRLAVLNDLPTPDGYRQALEKMFAMTMWAMMPERTLPDFNDSDRESSIAMLKQGLELFPERTDWKWIVTDGKAGNAPKDTSHFFPYAGYAVMRSDWSRDARCLITEGGPYGYSHQHEDKLSFIMSAYGSRLVSEAGIVPYFQSDSRTYSISARGHNVLSADGMQQHRYGRSRGTYVTKEPLDLNWRSTPQFDYVESSYGRGHDETWSERNLRGFVHTRRVLFVKPDYWAIIDSVVPEDKEEHTYASAFHLEAPEALIDADTARVTTTGRERATLAIIPLPAPDLTVKIIKGQTEPELLGWIGNDTLDLVPVPTAYYTRRAKGPVHTLYVLAPAPPGKASPIDRVEPGTTTNAAVSAKIVFAKDAVYGRGADEVAMTAEGEVVARRADGTTFSSRRAATAK